MLVLGFVPYTGDWLEVMYYAEPGAAHIKALSVKPLNSRRVDQVICLCVTHLTLTLVLPIIPLVLTLLSRILLGVVGKHENIFFVKRGLFSY